MSMFREAVSECSALKALFYGPGGGGKSYSVALFMIGLAREAPGAKVAWIDTGELAVDWLVDLFAQAKVPLFILRARSMGEIAAAIGDACSIGAVGLVIDQWTDLYHEVLTSWRRRRVEIPVSERDAIRDEMRELHEKLKSSPLHTVVIARAKDEWSDGVRSGLKVDADAGAVFAPALTVLMERVPFARSATGEERALTLRCPRCGAESGVRCQAVTIDQETQAATFSEARRSHAQRIELGERVAHYRRATVEKDRSATIDGQTFMNPTFRMFAGVLAHGGLRGTRHVVLDVPLVERVPSPVVEERARAARRTRRDAAMEWLLTTLRQSGLEGTKQSVKEARVDALLRIFRRPSLVTIETLEPEDIERGVDKLRAEKGLSRRETETKPRDVLELEDAFAARLDQPVG